MGGAAAHAPAAAQAARTGGPVMVQARPSGQAGGAELVAREGEIVGLAGLAGHGQARLLLEIFAAATARKAGVPAAAPVALVPGDRQTDGIFPLWSIAALPIQRQVVSGW